MKINRAHERKHHIIYKTTCTVTGSWYIGMHSTDNLNDGYIGSGRRLWKSIKKYGKEHHYCEVLEHLPDRKSLSLREEQIITNEVRSDPLCMNLRNGGTGSPPGKIVEHEVRKKVSTGLKKFYKSERGTEIKAKISLANTDRNSRNRVSRAEKLDKELAAFTLSRDEIISSLIQPDGKLNKNATRSLAKNILMRNENLKLLAPRERTIATKWNFIFNSLQNPLFGENLVKLIDAYVFSRTDHPKCKICQKHTTFFRFNQPYAIYCGAQCQLLDPDLKNPVHSRWK